MEKNRLSGTFERFALAEGILGTVVSVLILTLPSFGLDRWLLIFATFTGLLAWLSWVSTASTKPQIDASIFSSEAEVDGKCYVEVPTSHDMLVAANKYARSVYGRDAFTLAESERWWQRNPWFFGVLRDEWGRWIGNFSVVPLTEEGVRYLKSGGEEKRIHLDWILLAHEMQNAAGLFLASLVAKGQGTELGKVRASRLFSGMVSYFRTYYGNESRTLLAIAATVDGTRVLDRLPHIIAQPGEARADGHDLYEIAVDYELLNQVEAIAKRRTDPPSTKFRAIPSTAEAQ